MNPAGVRIGEEGFVCRFKKVLAIEVGYQREDGGKPGIEPRGLRFLISMGPEECDQHQHPRPASASDSL
jgi:hypothetical protein